MVAVAVGKYGSVLFSRLSNLPSFLGLSICSERHEMKKYWQNILEHWTNKVKSHFEQTGGLHLAASKCVYNLADKNLLLFLGEFFWVLCITLLKELFKSSFMLRQFCLVIFWYSSERKKPTVLLVPSVKPCPLLLLLVPRISDQKGSLLSSRLTPAY